MSTNRNLSKLVDSNNVAQASSFKSTDTIIDTAMFRTNPQTLSSSTTIDSDENASVAGPITIADGVDLIINGNLTVV